MSRFDEEHAEQIAGRIRLARQLAGLTQEEAARALEVTVRTYARWESADSHGFVGELPKIAKALATTVEELRGPESTPEVAESEVAAELRALRAELGEMRALLERLVPADTPKKRPPGRRR